MIKAFIYGQKWKEQDKNYVLLLLEKLSSSKIDYRIYKSYAKQIPIEGIDTYCIDNYQELKEYQPDFVITLGGDGTILSAATIIRDLETPIMGINLGRLGFLASIEQERISDAIDKLVAGEYSITERSMIRVDSKPDIFGDINFGLNDFTLLKRDNSAMVIIHAFVDDYFLNSYWADGLIISTPTGSTGYSLSCGGPIIFPSSDNFILTPVAPHNLNVRPVVISGKNVIKLKIEGRAENFLCTLDSRNTIVTAEHEIRLRKNTFVTKTITLHGDNFMKTIRNKLNWGQDKRNYASHD